MFRRRCAPGRTEVRACSAEMLSGATQISRRRFWPFVLCSVTLLTTSSSVWADDAASPEVEAEYQQVINDALSEYERGSWEESAALFRRAHELRPSARTLRGLGLAAFEARRYADCIRYLSQALVDQRRPLTPKQREEIDATLTRAKLFVGYLTLHLTPASASVSINGQEVPVVADQEVIVDVGWLDVEARAEGHDTLNKRLRVNAGDHRTLELELPTHLQPVAADSPAQARETADPSARERAEITQPRAPESATTGPASRPFATWKWVASGAAVAALGAGAALLIVQKTQAPDYTAECVNTKTPPSNCESRKTLLGSTLWNGSIIGLSVGAGLTALSAVLFALDASSTHDERPASAWACHGEGELGVGCHVRF